MLSDQTSMPDLLPDKFYDYLIFTYLLSNFDYWMEYALVHPLIVYFAWRSEYFCLHSSADNPEGVCDDITEKTTETSWDRVKLEWIIFPAVFFLVKELGFFVKGEIYCVKQGDAKYWYWIAYYYLILVPELIVIVFWVNSGVRVLDWFRQ